MKAQEHLTIYYEDELNENKHSSLGMKPHVKARGECHED